MQTFLVKFTLPTMPSIFLFSRIFWRQWLHIWHLSSKSFTLKCCSLSISSGKYTTMCSKSYPQRCTYVLLELSRNTLILSSNCRAFIEFLGYPLSFGFKNHPVPYKNLAIKKTPRSSRIFSCNVDNEYVFFKENNSIFARNASRSIINQPQW